MAASFFSTLLLEGQLERNLSTTSTAQWAIRQRQLLGIERIMLLQQMPVA